MNNIEAPKERPGEKKVEEKTAEPVNWEREAILADLLSRFSHTFNAGLIMTSDRAWGKMDADIERRKRGRKKKQKPLSWNEFLFQTVVNSLEGGEEQFNLLHQVGYPLWHEIQSAMYGYEIAVKERDSESLLVAAHEFRQLRPQLESFLEKWDEDGFLLKVTMKKGEFHHTILPSPLKKDETLKKFDELARKLVK